MGKLWNVPLHFLATAAEDKSMIGRIFDLDLQTLMDAVILACAIFFLFALLSYLVFDPARELLRKRQEKIAADMEAAAKEKEDAMQFKAEYDDKLQSAQKDVDALLSEGRKRAKKQQDDIVKEANAEAGRILARANKEVELEKNKAKDEMKQEIVSVAAAMAGRFVSEQLDANKQALLVDEVLQEIGEETWQNG